MTRMPNQHIPKKLLYGDLLTGKRSQRGQKKRFNDTMKASIKSFDIDLKNWESVAQDWPRWRSHFFSKGESARLKWNENYASPEPATRLHLMSSAVSYPIVTEYFMQAPVLSAICTAAAYHHLLMTDDSVILFVLEGRTTKCLHGSALTALFYHTYFMQIV